MSNESNLRICQKDVINQGGKYLVTFELKHDTLYIIRHNKPHNSISQDYLLNHDHIYFTWT